MAEFLTGEDRRTHYCGDLRKEDIGKEVRVMGWVQRQRDLGALIFIDLRDRTGLLQLAFDRDLAAEPFDKAFSCRAEYVVVAHGVVAARGRVAGTPAVAYCTDATVMGGAMGIEGDRGTDVRIFRRPWTPAGRPRS